MNEQLAKNLVLRTCRRGPFMFRTNDQYLGRTLDLYGEFSEDEAQLFDELIKPGDIALDIGAHIGCHTVVMARKAEFVVAMEPLRVIYQNMCGNLALNDIRNVLAMHAAAGAKMGYIKVPPLDYDVADNFGGIGLGQLKDGETVQQIAIDDINLPRCNFIKIDVEGMENDVLVGARQTIQKFMPILYVENDRPDRSKELLTRLFASGYKNLYWHFPMLYRADNFNGNTENVFYGMGALNVICFPDEREFPQGYKINSPDDWWEGLRSDPPK